MTSYLYIRINGVSPADPEKPNIAATIWRTVAHTNAKRYYFEPAFSPSIFWVDLEKLKFEPGSKPGKLDLSSRPVLSSEASGQFTVVESLKFLAH